MLEILNGRSKFYQWDLEQKLIVDDSIIAVHYDNGTGDALVCPVYEYMGQYVADVPNIMLQTVWAIKCYAYCGECVRAEKVYEVEKRSRPDDYVYTETETLRYSTLYERVKTLEEQHTEEVESVAAQIEETNSRITEQGNTIDGMIVEFGGIVETLFNSMEETENGVNAAIGRIEELEQRPTGGSTNIYWVDITLNYDDMTATANRTIAEICEANNANNVVMGRATQDGNTAIYNIGMCAESGVMLIANMGFAYSMVMLTPEGGMIMEGEVIVNHNVYVGECYYTGNGYTNGLTYTDVKAERDNNRGVIGYYTDNSGKHIQMGLTEITDTYAKFVGIDGEYLYTLITYKDESKPTLTKTPLAASGGSGSKIITGKAEYIKGKFTATFEGYTGSDLYAMGLDLLNYEVVLLYSNIKYHMEHMYFFNTYYDMLFVSPDSGSLIYTTATLKNDGTISLSDMRTKHIPNIPSAITDDMTEKYIMVAYEGDYKLLPMDEVIATSADSPLTIMAAVMDGELSYMSGATAEEIFNNESMGHTELTVIYYQEAIIETYHFNKLVMSDEAAYILFANDSGKQIKYTTEGELSFVEDKSGEYELIKQITLEEATGAIDITKDSLDNDIKLKAALVVVNTPLATETGYGYIYVYSKDFQLGLAYVNNIKQSSYQRISKAEITQRYGYWSIVSYGSAASGGSNYYSVIINKEMIHRIKDYPTIDKIRISGSIIFDKGTTVELWGVRA